MDDKMNNLAERDTDLGPYYDDLYPKIDAYWSFDRNFNCHIASVRYPNFIQRFFCKVILGIYWKKA